MINYNTDSATYTIMTQLPWELSINYIDNYRRVEPILKYYIFRENAVKTGWHFIEGILRETDRKEAVIMRAEHEYYKLMSANEEVIERRPYFDDLSIHIKLARIKVEDTD